MDESWWKKLRVTNKLMILFTCFFLPLSWQTFLACSLFFQIRPCDILKGICLLSFNLVTHTFARGCTCINHWGTITWSEMGKENIQTNTLFTWSGGPRSSGVSFFCFVSPRAWKQKKLTPLDRGPPFHVNRP